VPNTVGDIEVSADLTARRISACVDVPAPEDRGGRGRCSWLLGQLTAAPSGLVIEAYPKNARTPYVATLSQAVENRDLLLGEDKREPTRFRLTLTQEMGAGRKTSGRKPGFIDSILNLVETLYGSVVQNLAPWAPKAPKISAPPAVAASVDDDHDDPTDRWSRPTLLAPTPAASPVQSAPPARSFE
jgi:hypothetical protein